MVLKEHKSIQLEAKPSVKDSNKFSKGKRKHFEFFVQVHACKHVVIDFFKEKRMSYLYMFEWVCVMIYNTAVCDITYDTAGICKKKKKSLKVYGNFAEI